jgi:hypothetical protein
MRCRSRPSRRRRGGTGRTKTEVHRGGKIGLSRRRRLLGQWPDIRRFRCRQQFLLPRWQRRRAGFRRGRKRRGDRLHRRRGSRGRRWNRGGCGRPWWRRSRGWRWWRDGRRRYRRRWKRRLDRRRRRRGWNRRDRLQPGFRQRRACFPAGVEQHRHSGWRRQKLRLFLPPERHQQQHTNTDVDQQRYRRGEPNPAPPPAA